MEHLFQRFFTKFWSEDIEILLDKQYTLVEEMFKDLQNYVVDAVFVDVYALVGYKSKLKERYLKVVAIIETKAAYGFVLSGPSQYLKPDIESMIFSRQQFMEDYVRSIKDDIPVRIIKVTYSDKLFFINFHLFKYILI